MDPSGWIAIGILGIVALGADIVIAAYFAGYIGPRRARRLIVEDKEFVETRERLARVDIVVHDLKSMREGLAKEIQVLRSDFVAQSEDIRGLVNDARSEIINVKADYPDLDGFKKDVELLLERKMSALEGKVSLDLARFEIPEKELDKVGRSLKYHANKVFDIDKLLDEIEAMIDEKLKKYSPKDTDVMEDIELESLLDPDVQLAVWEILSPVVGDLQARILLEKAPKFIKVALTKLDLWDEAKVAAREVVIRGG